MADELTYEQYLQQQIEAYNATKVGTPEHEKAAREIGVLYASAKDGLFQLNTDHPVTHTQAEWDRMAQTKVLTTTGEEIDTSNAYDHAFVTTMAGHDAVQRAAEIAGRLAKDANIDLTPTVPPLPTPEKTAAPAVDTDEPERGQDDVSGHPSAPKADEKPAPIQPAPPRPDTAKAEAGAPEVTPEFIAKLKDLQKQLEAGKGKSSFVGSGGIEGGPKASAEEQEKVKLIQQAVQIAGGKLALDGDWGMESDAATREVQAKLGLKTDGDIGKEALPKLIEEARKKLEAQKAQAAGKATEAESESVAKDAAKGEKDKGKEADTVPEATTPAKDPEFVTVKLGDKSMTPTELGTSLGMNENTLKKFEKDYGDVAVEHGGGKLSGDVVIDTAKYPIDEAKAKANGLTVEKAEKKASAPEPDKGDATVGEAGASPEVQGPPVPLGVVTVTPKEEMTASALGARLGLSGDKLNQFTQDYSTRGAEGGDRFPADAPVEIDTEKYGITEKNLNDSKQEWKKGGPDAAHFTPEKTTPARNPDDPETVSVSGLDKGEDAPKYQEQLERKAVAAGMAPEQAQKFAKAVADAVGGSALIDEKPASVDVDQFMELNPGNIENLQKQGINVAEKSAGR